MTRLMHVKSGPYAPPAPARELTAVSADDIRYAQRLGYAVKLLAVAELDGDRISARVHPAMLPTSHALASVRGSLNAVFVEGENEAGSLSGPPTELLLMRLIPLVGGTPLPVLKICASATAASGAGVPVADVPPMLKPHVLSSTRNRPCALA